MKITILRIILAIIAIDMLAVSAEAVLGGRRRTRRRTAIVVSSATQANAAQSQQQTATAQQQTATAQQQTADAQQQTATAQQQASATTTPAQAAPAPAATDGKPLPMGTVVSVLPPGCVATPVNGVEYYYGGGNFYRAVFQGNQLVYVTTQPK